MNFKNLETHSSTLVGKNFLDHAGKKGMRWRNKKSPNNLNKIANRDSYTKNGFTGLSRGERALVAAGSVSVGIALARVGAKVVPKPASFAVGFLVSKKILTRLGSKNIHSQGY